MKICLIRPSVINELGVKGQIAVAPIGLAYIAGSLQAAGHDVVALDAVAEGVDQYRPFPADARWVSHGLTNEETAERIDPDTELIGVTSMFSMQWLHERDVLTAIRKRHPHIPIVLGGEHANTAWEHVLETCDAVDYCVRGEGEETIVELVKTIEEGGDPTSIDGLACRKEGRPVTNPPRKRIREIDEIAPPAWSLFPVDTYVSNDLVWGVNLGRSMPILASRGCPYQCTFCSSPSMWTTYWNVRTPQNVITEMKRYMKDYGAKSFNFYDLTAIVKKEWILEFTKTLIEEDLNVTWQLPSGTRTEAIDDEVAALLYRSGCRHLNYAPESGSPSVLKRIKKKIKPERMLDSMRQGNRAGLRIKANIIFGFPEDTWKDIRETYWFILKMAAAGVRDIGAFPYAPYPGSELFNQLEQKGVVKYGDEYFHKLMTFSDPTHRVSFAENFSARTLHYICMSAMAMFYLSTVVFRPWRGFAMFYNLVSRRPGSKLEQQLAHARRRREGLKAYQEAQQGEPVAAAR